MLPTENGDGEFCDMFADLPAQDPYDIKKDHIAAELTALMVHSKKTRSEMATGLGWPRSRVTSVLSGKANLTVKTVYEFCSMLGYDVDLIYRRHNLMPSLQPWQSEVEISSFKSVKNALPISVRIQTAQEVARDISRGASQTFYLSLGQATEPVMRVEELSQSWPASFPVHLDLDSSSSTLTIENHLS